MFSQYIMHMAGAKNQKKLGIRLMLTKYGTSELSHYGTNLSNFQLGSILGQRNGKDSMTHRINLLLML